MPEKKEKIPFNKLKKIKYDILKRCKEVEEKHGSEKTSSFRWHETKSVMQNLAFWKLADRGVITIDDVKTAIFQLEKDGLIELVDRNHLRLTSKGSQIAQEIRTMRLENVPDLLLGTQSTIPSEEKDTMNCPQCGEKIEVESSFCKFCGAKIKVEDEFCTYCGASVIPGSEFCSTCGKKLE